MPYSGAGDPSLPKGVKKLNDKQRAQFVAVFNAAIKDGKDEKYAYAAAYSQAQKHNTKDYIYGGDVMDRQVSQADADYDSIGGLGDKAMACANCHWFVGPQSCMLVSGNISPTGLSKFWMKAQLHDFEGPTPQPVYMVEPDDDEDDDAYTMPMMGGGKEQNIVKTVVDGVKSLFQPNIIVKEFGVGSNRMVFTKDTASGQLRFVATVSNNFRDREREVIPEAAHREFVAWAEENKAYPELWLWHSGPLSRWGQADTLDVVDGFLVASGLVDKGKEHIANNLAAMESPVGVSHGFLSRKEGDTIARYRSFELSPLYMSNAANQWTDFATIQKEGSMPFTKQKREFLLKAGIPEATITTMETSLSDLSKELKSRGVDWKDYDDAPGGADETDVWGNPIVKEVANANKTKPAEYANVPDDKFADKANWKWPIDDAHIKAARSYFNHEGQREKGGYSDSQWAAIGGKIAAASGEGWKYENGKLVQGDKAIDNTEGDVLSSKEFKALDGRIGGIETRIGGIESGVKELTDAFKAAMFKLTASDDQKTADFFKAQVAKLPGGYQASASSGNTPAAGAQTAAQIKAAVESTNPNLTFFEETVLGGMKLNG